VITEYSRVWASTSGALLKLIGPFGARFIRLDECRIIQRHLDDLIVMFDTALLWLYAAAALPSIFLLLRRKRFIPLLPRGASHHSLSGFVRRKSSTTPGAWIGTHCST
jgi:hypothetical protein